MTFSVFLIIQSFTIGSATSLPSDEKVTDRAPFKWPSSVYSGALVAASQSLTVLSSEPDAISLSFSEKATDRTPFKWPSNVCSGAPVVAS
jgi:hypothetical protein